MVLQAPFLSEQTTGSEEDGVEKDADQPDDSLTRLQTHFGKGSSAV
jgi:hypothetical protein